MSKILVSSEGIKRCKNLYFYISFYAIHFRFLLRKNGNNSDNKNHHCVLTLLLLIMLIVFFSNIPLHFESFKE